MEIFLFDVYCMRVFCHFSNVIFKFNKELLSWLEIKNHVWFLRLFLE